MTKIMFDIEAFAEDFKKTLDWMLKDERGKRLEERIQEYKTSRKKLEDNGDCLDALQMIVELIITNSFYRRRKDFEKNWHGFVSAHGKNFRSEDAMNELYELVGEKKQSKISQLLAQCPTIKAFTIDLSNKTKHTKGDVLGEKGMDIYLRDFGYWNRPPIDIHEKRFIVRTGIYHRCSDSKSSDPIDYQHLQDALVNFCHQYLIGYTKYDINFSDAPGIVDLFIWSYCAQKDKKEKDRFDICGKTPACKKCQLNKTCLYALNQLCST
jgi:hypothetical protein